MKNTLATFPRTLRDLCSHPAFVPFGSSSDDWLNDADRMERCHEAAADGCDGSTQAEIIQDWRDFLDTLHSDTSRTLETDAEESELAALVESIAAEIDACQAWHEANGSLYTEVG